MVSPNSFIVIASFPGANFFIGRKHLLEKSRACELQLSCSTSAFFAKQNYSIWQHLVTSVNSWHGFIIVYYDAGFHFFFSSSVWNTNHLNLVRIWNCQYLCLIFPLTYWDIIQRAPDHFPCLQLFWCNVIWFTFSVSKRPSNVHFLLWQISQCNWIVKIISKNMISFVEKWLHEF